MTLPESAHRHVTGAHIGTVFASHVALLNSQRLLGYVTVQSMRKRLLALSVVLICTNTTVITQTATRPAHRMTVFGPVVDLNPQGEFAAIVQCFSASEGCINAACIVALYQE